jgi:hypothetical protein
MPQIQGISMGYIRTKYFCESVHCSKNHVSTTLDKLHAANRTQAARVAREQRQI